MTVISPQSSESSPDASVLQESLTVIETKRVRKPSFNVPITPLVTIKASRPWSPLDLRFLWSHRELLYFLIWRDVKVRYKQTLLGATWAIIQPLIMMIIFTFFLSKVARLPTEGVPSPLFYYAGFALWTFFSNAVLSGANSLIGNTNLITKIYVPRLIIPSAAVLAGLIDFAIASLLFVPMIFYFDLGLTWSILFLLPLSIILTTLALGAGILFSALNTKYRDVRYALPFLLQVWMFMSPIMYPSSIVPRQWRWVFSLNPLTGIIESYRSSLFGLPLHHLSLAYSILFTAVLLSVAAYTFRRMEKSFAEVI
ncbi:MAG: ABC transporter permease [Acidobacteriota bacterium]